MKNHLIFIVLIALIVNLTASAQTAEEIIETLEIDTLLNSGPKDNRINFAIANLTNQEGTSTYETIEELNADIELLLELMDVNNPDQKSGFSHYRDFFNFYSVYFPEPLVFVTEPSFYEMAFEIRDQLFLPWANDDHGWVTMMYSFKGGGGGGAGVDRDERTGFAQLYGLDITTTFHEFNHTMPGVHDEYTATGGFTNFVPLEGANVTGQSLHDEIPWRLWIEEETPLPTPFEEIYNDQIGLFQGNISGYFGSYRPTANGCYMGAGGFEDENLRDLCSPCLQRFICMLYQYVNVIENPIPASSNIVVDGNETVTFSADILKPNPNTQKYQWFVNGVLYAEDVETVDVEFDACHSYTVELVVRDETEFVRYDEKFADLYPEPKQSHTWTVDQSAVTDYDLEAEITTTAADCSGLATGSISVESSGGAGGYQLYLDGEVASNPISNLAAGSYSIVIMDGNGCSITEEIEITQDPILDFEICSDFFDGSWNLSATDVMEGDASAEGVSYLWSTGSTLPTIQVTEGTYNLAITSNEGCSITREITIEEVSTPFFVSVTEGHASNGDNNGNITLDVLGGLQPYTYSWYQSILNDLTSAESDHVISSGFVGSHEPKDAFDNDDGTARFWADNFDGNNYIGFDFGSDETIEAYSITSNRDIPNRDARSWILQSSTNGSNWSDVVEVVDESFSEPLEKHEFTLDDPVTARYFRLLITENWGDAWLAIQEVEFAALNFVEMPEFENKMGAYDLAPGTYMSIAKDDNQSCEQMVTTIENVEFTTQTLNVIQSGNFEVAVENADPSLDYYWSSDSEMTMLLEIGSDFQPDTEGQYYVRAYDSSIKTFVSEARGFKVTMPDAPEVSISSESLEIVDPIAGVEYVWYDSPIGGNEVHIGNSYTPTSDGYYYVAVRTPTPTTNPIDPETIDGIQLWMDASDLDADGETDSGRENTIGSDWTFRVGGKWEENSFFIYRSQYLNGLGVADFATIWFQRLDGGTDQLRTVIMVYEENEFSPDHSAPLWGLKENLPRHSDASQLLSNTAPSTTLDGSVYLNGELVDPLTTSNPMEFIVLSSVFTQLVTNRIGETVMEWDGKVAELIVWDIPLTHDQVTGVSEFLRKKWLSTADLESSRVQVPWGAELFEDADKDGFDESVDCDDNNPFVNSDAVEVCDGIDNDCDGQVDEGFETTFYADSDGDGYGDSEVTISACEAPLGYVSNATDCNDGSHLINPGTEEIPYNGIDDDCNPETLDDDLDQDGFNEADDCDDMNPAINPDQEETPYNGLDDDCDPETLDDDLDQDGFVEADDCDDMNPAINPDAEEIAGNDVDEDCDGAILALGLEDLTNHKVYPNPASGKLFIDLDSYVGDFKVTFFDMAGSAILNKSNLTVLELGEVEAGMYLLVISFNELNQTVVHRIIVE